MNRKICFKCHKRKVLKEFYPHPEMRDGHLNKCKVSYKLAHKARRSKERLRINPATNRIDRLRDLAHTKEL